MDLAALAHIDIIKSPKVTGKVTVKVTDVPLEEALTNILAAYDYTYIATESMIRVVPQSELVTVREQFVTRIYQITYADANEVATALSGFVSDRGKVALNKGTSHIIVTDTERKIRAIDKFIEQIDHRTSQVLVEVRIYDITTSEGFELGAEWHAGRNAPYTADLMTLPDEVVTNVTEPYTVHEREFTEYDREDRPGHTPAPWGFRDAYFETRDLEAWEYNPGISETESVYIDPPAIMTNRRRKPFVGSSFDRITGGTLRFSVLNDAVDIDLALNILHKQVEAKLLANPRILVLDNETANFEIIREIPYRELLQVAREDPITYTEFKNVGVNLKVTPHIARDGMIRLRIVPEFGAVVGQNAEGAPTVDTRRANTVAMIKNGQTIVIGGLRKRETSKDISKVPVLGDIPLVGGLFRSKTESVVINELVIFITTRIVTEPVLSEVEKRQLDATELASPEMAKMRLEHNNQLKNTADKPILKEFKELINLLSEK
jgi:type II secretory pathway component GspD/PulD (secretin)